ncbi:unnamed protein product [Adineta ricciae]|uniref:Uncharacterized protein n=2 Tax=Adineta ricciae TaxID=249248 RepID=A0A814GAZ7_ADIRI|nr:unnamed protein product [Adineta ricciae]
MLTSAIVLEKITLVYSNRYEIRQNWEDSLAEHRKIQKTFFTTSIKRRQKIRETYILYWRIQRTIPALFSLVSITFSDIRFHSTIGKMSAVPKTDNNTAEQSPNSMSAEDDMKMFQAARRTGRRNALGDFSDQLSQVSVTNSTSDVDNIAPRLKSMSIQH